MIRLRVTFAVLRRRPRLRRSGRPCDARRQSIQVAHVLGPDYHHCTVAVGVTAFLLTTKQEKESFEAKVRLQGIGWRPKTENHYISAYSNPSSFTQFTGLTREAIDKRESNALNNFIASKSPKAAITSNGIDSDKTQVNVTMPYVDLDTHEALDTEDSSKIAFPSILLIDLTPKGGMRARKISNFTHQVWDDEDFC
jgi:hypothetical protein